MPRAAAKIVVAEENPILAQALAGLLRDTLGPEGHEVAAEAPVTQAGLCGARPDVVLLDPLLAHPLKPLVAALRAAVPGVRLIAYATRPTVELARYCVEMGFRGVLPKTVDAKALARSVRVVCEGGTFVHKSVGRGLARGQIARTAGRDVTEREETILRMAALGHANRAIAEALELSPKTVDTHRARAMQKLEIASKPELVRMAAARGWLL